MKIRSERTFKFSEVETPEGKVIPVFEVNSMEEYELLKNLIGGKDDIYIWLQEE